jgi:hypothetical protein
MHGSQPSTSPATIDNLVQGFTGRFARRVQANAGRIAAATTIALLATSGVAGASTGHHARSRTQVSLSLRSTPATVSVPQGRSARSKIRATVRNGSARVVSLRVAHLPAGASATFRPSSVKPGASATLTLTTTSATPAGRYTVRVSATSLARRRRHRSGHLLAHAASLSGSGNANLTVSTHRTVSLDVDVMRPATSSQSAPSDPSASGPIPTHVETWSYDDGCNGGVGASPTLVRAWLTYAESNCGYDATKAQSDCQDGATKYCTTLAYVDANKVFSDGLPVGSSAPQSWWLHQPGHDDAAHRLTEGSSSWGNAYYLDGSNSSVDSWLHNYVSTKYNSFNGLMMDDVGANPQEQFYGSGQTSSSELNSTSKVMAEHQDVADAMTHADGSPFLQVDNALQINSNLATAFPLLDNSHGVVGLLAEGAPYSDGTLTSYYSTLLDDMSYVDSRDHDFITLLSYDNHGSTVARRIQEATVLLGYSPGHIVDWADLEQSNSNLSVWPEEGIYPAQPIQTMATPGGAGCLAGNGQVCSSGGHNDLQVAANVYRREFKACYNHGTSIGPCAAIVNDSSNSVTVKGSWLKQNYQHEITMNGGDVQSGGTLNLSGNDFNAGSSTVGPDDAVLLSS